jgi:hypothetical protein
MTWPTLIFVALVRPTMHLLSTEFFVIPFLLLKILLSSRKNVRLSVCLVFAHLLSNQLNFDLDAIVLVALEAVKSVDISVRQASHVGSSYGMTLLGKNGGVVAAANSVSTVVVKDRRLNRQLGGKVALDWVVPNAARAIADPMEDLADHLKTSLASRLRSSNGAKMYQRTCKVC